MVKGKFAKLRPIMIIMEQVQFLYSLYFKNKLFYDIK